MSHSLMEPVETQSTTTIQANKFLKFYEKVVDFSIFITSLNVFHGVIITTIFLNAIFLALETYDVLVDSWGSAFKILDSIFLFIYTVEFVLKVIAKPKQFWSNGYDIFDFIILLISYIQLIIEAATKADQSKLNALKILRALRTLRTLRTVSHIRGLQVLVVALIDTVRTWMLNIIALLLLIMFLFAIIGFYLFGYQEDGDVENWGTLGRSMLTLFSFVTADGWTEFQSILESKGYNSSVFFTITIIIFGNFIFTNIFVGVIIMNISDATDEFRREKEENKKELLRKKKQYMMDRQHNDVKKMLIKQREGKFASFKELVQKFQNTLRHDDSMMMADICTNLIWIETFIRTLDHMDTTMYRIQQLHFEMANHLAMTLEERLKKRPSKQPSKVNHD